MIVSELVIKARLNVAKSVFTVREALRLASFCLVDCGT